MHDATYMRPQQGPGGRGPWHTPCVTGTGPDGRLRAATARRKQAVKKADDARLAERAAILAALESGLRQVDVVEITGYTREHVRRLAEAERTRLEQD